MTMPVPSPGGSVDISRAAALLSALSAPSRLHLLTGVLRRQERQEDCSIRTLAAVTDRSQRALVKDVIRLQESGLVSLDGDRVSADLSILHTVARAIEAVLPISSLLAEDADLARFFQHGRLVTVPESAVVRRRLAKLVARLLPTDRQMSEGEVNAILAQVHDDYASLRRLLVDTGFLTRRGSSDYRRAVVD